MQVPELASSIWYVLTNEKIWFMFVASQVRIWMWELVASAHSSLPADV
jgi:hypothetical protein